MEDAFKHTEQIDAWLKGELTETERLSFEQKLAEDTDLAAEVKAYQLMVEGIEYAAIKAEVKKKTVPIVRKLEREGFLPKLAPVVPMNPKSRRPRILLWVLTTAATLVILLIAAYWLLQSSSNTEAIFDTYYLTEQTEVSIQIERHEAVGFASDKVKDAFLVKGLSFYQKGDYKNAQAALDDYTTNYPDENLASLYLGLSLMELKDYKQAQTVLAPLINIADFGQINMAKWYLALCYLHLEEAQGLESTKQLLQDLARNPNSGYSNQAQRMLNDLASF